MDSIVHLHKTKWTKIPHLKKRKKKAQRQTNKPPAGRNGGCRQRWRLQAEMAASRKHLEGAWGLLCLQSTYAQCDVPHLVGPQSTGVWAKADIMLPARDHPGFSRPVPCSQNLVHNWFWKWCDRASSDSQREMQALLPTFPYVSHTKKAASSNFLRITLEIILKSDISTSGFANRRGNSWLTVENSVTQGTPATQGCLP